MAAASLASVLALPAGVIDYERARGMHDGSPTEKDQPSGFNVLLTCRPLLLFAVSVCYSTLPMPPCCPSSARSLHCRIRI
jgi:hypothetical protein